MIKSIGKKLKDQRGLTLIELLAVIVILGIIAAIAVPSIGNIIEKSRFDATKAEAISAINAAKLYVAAGGDVTTMDIDTTATTADSTPDLEDYIDALSYWDTVTITLTDGVYTFTGDSATTDDKFVNAITGKTLEALNTLEFSDL